MNAYEKAQALLALRGKGATSESLKQMANIYVEDTDLTPDAFVTPKFEAAKAITAFGGYALYLGLATEEQVINQREVYGESYSSLDFSLEKDAFHDLVDGLAASIIAATNDKARTERKNGNFATVKVNALLKILGVLTRTNLEPTSQATKDALAGAGVRIAYLTSKEEVVVKVKEEVLV